MDTSAIIWITIGVYVIFMVVTGILNKQNASTLSSFTVGGRNAGAWISALSYGTAYFSAVMFVGYAGNTGWSFGLWAIAAGIGNAIFGTWLAWKVLARRTRDIATRLNLKTMPQFFSARYDSTRLKYFSAAVIYIFLLPYSASVYKGLTSVCSVLLNIDERICMVVIAVASAVILILGGYLAALKADFIQGIIMMAGIVLLIIFVMRAPAVSDGGLGRLWDYMQQHDMAPLPTDSAVSLIATVLMTSFGTWGLPQMIHKYYGIKDDREVKRGTSISTFFSLLVAGGGYFIGSLSHLFFADTLPAGGKDYIVPNMLVQARLPAVLLGVVLVLLIAASVSTLSSITLSASTTLSMDLIMPNSKKLNEHSGAVLTKVLCLLFVAASYIIANTDTPILDMMSYSWGILSGSFLAPYLLALYWKRVTRKAAWSAVVSGFIVAFIPAGSMLINLLPHQNTGIFGITEQWASMGPQFACAAMLLSLVVCVAVTWKTAKSEPQQTEFYNTVR